MKKSPAELRRKTEEKHKSAEANRERLESLRLVKQKYVHRAAFKKKKRGGRRVTLAWLGC